jgi:hypothetical protein
LKSESLTLPSIGEPPETNLLSASTVYLFTSK